MNEQEWLDKVRQELEKGIDELDAGTRSKLTYARQSALQRRNERNVNVWIPAAALASVCLIIAVLINVPEQETRDSEIFNDIDLMTTSDNLELLEDLEFYEWLEAYDFPS